MSSSASSDDDHEEPEAEVGFHFIVLIFLLVICNNFFLSVKKKIGTGCSTEFLLCFRHLPENIKIQFFLLKGIFGSVWDNKE